MTRQVRTDSGGISSTRCGEDMGGKKRTDRRSTSEAELMDLMWRMKK